MIQSMTGFAAASAETPRGRLSVELRSVNARFLDLQFRIADELRALEPALRELVAARISRGKLDCRVFLNEAAGAASGQLNSEALAQLRQLASQVQKEMPHAAPLRIADVLRWPGVMSEAALDKADVDEELTRLNAHFGEVERTLAEGGARSSAVGKRLDFIAQELNREANTLASKAASQEISDCALELKLLIEQMREQVQNIE